MSDAVFGKKSPSHTANPETESDDFHEDDALEVPSAGPVLRNSFSEEFAEEYDSYGEAVPSALPQEGPQEAAPPLETGWNEELPKLSPAQQREVPAEDMWGASGPTLTPSSAAESKPTPPKPQNSPKISVGKAPWEEDEEAEENSDLPDSPTATQPMLRAEPVWEKPEELPAAESTNSHTPSLAGPAADAPWQEGSFSTEDTEEEAETEENTEEDFAETASFSGGPKIAIPEHLQLPDPEPELSKPEVPPPPPPPSSPSHYAPPPRPEPALSEVQVALLEVVEHHHQWLASGGKAGHRAVITSSDFRGADFSGLYLAEASFRHADLPSSRFEGANLERVDFSEANLESCDFAGAVLTQADFRKAQLGQADFTDAQANEADFTGAELVGSILLRTQLEWAVFCDALLSGADLRQANLEKADLRSASLFRARLEGANLSQADCREANFDQAQMDDTVLQQTNLKGSHLTADTIQQADFSQAEAVPAAAVEDALAQEREWLQQEAARLEKFRMELEYQARALEEARQVQPPEAFRPEENDTPAREAYPSVSRAASIDTSYLRHLLGKNAKLFMKLGIVWLVAALLVLSISLSAFEVMDSSQLNFIELLLFAFIFFAPPGLCLMAMVKSNTLARLLQRMSDDDAED